MTLSNQNKNPFRPQFSPKDLEQHPWARVYLTYVSRLKDPDLVQTAWLYWWENSLRIGSENRCGTDFPIRKTFHYRKISIRHQPDAHLGLHSAPNEEGKFADEIWDLGLTTAGEEVGNRARLLSAVRKYAIETYRRELYSGKPTKTNEVFLRAALGEKPVDVARAVGLGFQDENILRTRAIAKAKKYLKPWVNL